MKPRYPLFTKILVWFFLSLVILGAVLYGAFDLQFRLDPRSPLLGQSGNRMAAVGRLISHELGSAFRGQWTEILARYSEAYQASFVLCSNDGERLAGKEIPIPLKVKEKITGTIDATTAPPHPPYPPPSSRPSFTVRTSDPTRYWVGVRVRVSVGTDRPPLPATLVAVSDSITGGGLFLDPTPWLIILAAIVFLSVVLWVPMVRSITRPIADITAATEEIARGRFDVRLDERRSDELGRLGRSINEMAARLGGLVRGQKRFLGDVAHELASPIARIQLGLGILEQRIDEAGRERVRDVADEAEHMSNLVNELLSFSRAEVNPAKVRLEPVKLASVVRRAIERERVEGVEIRVDVDEEIEVSADPELVGRALANVVRNAVRYAGDAGPIEVEALKEGDAVLLEVRDMGPGVPEEDLGRLFEPFYRPDASRERETGGSGLGLAIVKTCVETCRGSVRARNLAPTGFAVTMELDGHVSVTS